MRFLKLNVSQGYFAYIPTNEWTKWCFYMKCEIWLEHLYDSTLPLWQNEPWLWNGTMACGDLDNVVILGPTCNLRSSNM
jgi:hypothetical protein